MQGEGQILRNIDPEMDHPIRYEKGAVMYVLLKARDI
jgi:hypothetical protein